MVHFAGSSYRSHTACITEDQKYQGKLYKEKKPKAQPHKNDPAPHGHAPPANADNTLAVVNAPPRCPTPPPAVYSLGYHEQATLQAPNVFDFFEGSETPARRPNKPMHHSRMLEDSQPPAYSEPPMPSRMDVMAYQVQDEDKAFAQNGLAYGGEPLHASNERYDSYTTPAPKSKHSTVKSRDTDVETTGKKTDRKRKRKSSPTELDMSLLHAQDTAMSDAPPSFHTGLTGGLNRLLARPEFPPSPDDSGEFANSPLSPIKRAKQGDSKALLRAQEDWEVQQQKQRKTVTKTRDSAVKKEKERGRGRERERIERKNGTALVKVRPKKKRDESTKESRRQRHRQSSSSVSPPPERKSIKAIEYMPSGSQSPASNHGQVVVHPNGDLAPIVPDADSRAGLFMSFITKGPGSERGMSVNKALKRYHRERHDDRKRESSRGDEEKELWKDLRLRKNDRGEIVLFYAPQEASS